MKLLLLLLLPPPPPLMIVATMTLCHRIHLQNGARYASEAGHVETVGAAAAA
jgi:hypothetical protein